MKLHRTSLLFRRHPGSWRLLRGACSHGRNLSAFPATIVKVTADDGTTGWGEAGTLGGNYRKWIPRQCTRNCLRICSCSPAIQSHAGVLSGRMDALRIGHSTLQGGHRDRRCGTPPASSSDCRWPRC